MELGLPDATRMDVQKEQLSEAIQVNSLKELKAEMRGNCVSPSSENCDHNPIIK